jgi:hypothetical protein
MAPRDPGANETMCPEASNLSGRHQDTLRQIFTHPLSHNVEWRAVISLLREVGAVDERDDGKFAVTAAGQTVILTRPRNKDVDADELVDVRHFLETLGYQAQGRK